MYIWLAIWNKNTWILDSRCKLGFAILFSWGNGLFKTIFWHKHTEADKLSCEPALRYWSSRPAGRRESFKLSELRQNSREDTHTTCTSRRLSQSRQSIYLNKENRKYGRVWYWALLIKNYYWMLFCTLPVILVLNWIITIGCFCPNTSGGQLIMTSFTFQTP